jgi:hypothetical protein
MPLLGNQAKWERRWNAHPLEKTRNVWGFILPDGEMRAPIGPVENCIAKCSNLRIVRPENHS